VNGHTEMPTITFEEGADYDTLDSVISGWCARLWLTDGVILCAQWVTTDGDNNVNLRVWSNKAQDYATPLTIPIDSITRISIL
jgi:hypothetical protein